MAAEANIRIIVEAIRKAEQISLALGRTTLNCEQNGFDPAFRVLRHDIAIAVQKYLNAKQYGQD